MLNRTTLPIRRFSALLLALLLVPATASGAGIELQEQDSAAMGRVLAVRAWLQNPSTVFYNPAGLAYLESLSFALGDTMVFPSFNYEDPAAVNPKGSNVNTLVPPPHAYLTYARKFDFGRIGVGVGYNYPFGLTLDWGDDFSGRHLVTKSALSIPELTVGLGYAPIPEVAIGAAFVASPAHVYLKRYMGKEFGLIADDGSPIEDATVEMSGGGWGFGFNAGVQARPVPWLYIGAVYRSAIHLGLDGNAHFNIDGLSDRSAFPDQKVETAFELPHIVALGIGARFGSFYTEIDVDYTFWSVFEDIPLTFPEDQTGALSQSIPEQWKDGFTFRLGNEYAVTDQFKVRLGVGYDQTPAVDDYLTPMLPDSDRAFVMGGAGYTFDFGLSVDAAYGFTYFLPREVSGHACTTSDPQCVDSDGNLIPYAEDGSANWVGNRFPAIYNNNAQLVSLTLGMTL
jgi:long-chain fatty acid transport protein